jgi:hypothetical protein
MEFTRNGLEVFDSLPVRAYAALCGGRARHRKSDGYHGHDS